MASSAQATSTINTVDSAGTVGFDTSLALDGSGIPVTSCIDGTNSDLKMVHCNDPSRAGGDESLITVDSTGDVGLHTSLVLDASGNPVASYYDGTNSDLKLAHRKDAICAVTTLKFPDVPPDH